MRLWHGTRTDLEGPIQPFSTTNGEGTYISHDFGVGFYTYDTHKTAQLQQPSLKKLIGIELCGGLDTLKNIGCRIYSFNSSLIGELERPLFEWAMFVAYCRGFFQEDIVVQESSTGKIVKKPARELYPHCYKHYADIAVKYDVIIGPVSDGIMQYAFQAFTEERLGIQGLFEAMKFASLGSQIVFTTQKACDVLNYCGRINHYLARPFSLTVNELEYIETKLKDKVIIINRKYKTTRRDRYIDELLRDMECILRDRGEYY